MTMIVGVHLPRKIYLSADSRLTIKDPSSGKVQFKNDLIKCAGLCPNIRMAVAGSAKLAAYFSFELRKLVKKKTTINQFRQIVESNVIRIADSYLRSGGSTNEKVAFIFAGHGKSNGKYIDAGKVQRVIEPFKPQQDGSMHCPTLDIDILRAIGKLAEKIGKVNVGTRVWVPNLPSSRIFSLRLKLDGTSGPEFEECDCYSATIIHPKENTVKIDMSNSTLASIEATGVANLNDDTGLLAKFILEEAEARGFPSVGGCVFSMRVIPGDDYYLMGELKRKDKETGQLKTIFNIYEKNGAFAYQLQDGEEGLMRSFESFLNKKDSSAALADTEI